MLHTLHDPTVSHAKALGLVQEYRLSLAGITKTQGDPKAAPLNAQC